MFAPLRSDKPGVKRELATRAGFGPARDWNEVSLRYANYGTTPEMREIRYLLVEACAVIKALSQ